LEKGVWYENKFELFNRKTRLRVWRKLGEEYQERHLQQTVKHGGGSIMIWGCFAWSGVGNLVKIDGTIVYSCGLHDFPFSQSLTQSGWVEFQKINPFRIRL